MNEMDEWTNIKNRKKNSLIKNINLSVGEDGLEEQI